MEKLAEKISQQSQHKTLPEFALLTKNYSKDAWFIIGTLTHAQRTSAETQLRHFRELMDEIGRPNDVFGRRLHWIVRVGGGEGTANHTHLHFLLAEHKVTDGHTVKLTADEVIATIKKFWSRFGMPAHQEIERFDSSKNGLSYVLREENKDQERIVEMSQALRAQISKLQQSSKLPPERDPLVESVVNQMRARGARVGFGDQMDELRAEAVP
ncbi:MAG: hypothetical protein ACKODK_19465 [Opitutaceae bacterium]